jgi:predicted Fe-Mo cluster-binding NifX family protein
MIIGMPTAQGRLAMHFGHCEAFRFFECSKETGITRTFDAVPPPHEPGVLPRWTASQGADIIIAGGMGIRAQNLFQQQGIEVLVGAPNTMEPGEIVQAYLNNTLECGTNMCDH